MRVAAITITITDRRFHPASFSLAQPQELEAEACHCKVVEGSQQPFIDARKRCGNKQIIRHHVISHATRRSGSRASLLY
jgi:hypothetical protein